MKRNRENIVTGTVKANSELEAIKAFGPGRAIIVRPTYMIGPSMIKLDRFIHWPIRLAKGGEVMVPGKIDDPVQHIDVRDVAEWIQISGRTHRYLIP
ncbi:MAG: hypothetical protein IPG82_17685 [Saprospiraceae bacterium]|nr:hypothetical protein [Saprospiraceae bacterium]